MNKAILKRLAVELREEVGADPRGAFDPHRLAGEYGVGEVSLSGLDCAAAAQHFRELRPTAFSGALVPVGSGSFIVENDVHDPQRRRSTAAHEMAHWVREHPFTVTLMASERRRGIADREHEAEADELAGELLLPAAAARWLAYRRATEEDVADRFDVSVEMARWRMTAAGARKIAARADAARRR